MRVSAYQGAKARRGRMSVRLVNDRCVGATTHDGRAPNLGLPGADGFRQVRTVTPAMRIDRKADAIGSVVALVLLPIAF